MTAKEISNEMYLRGYIPTNERNFTSPRITELLIKGVFIMSLQEICALSNQYGSNPEFVLAGGGNTSFKDEKYLYIKPSGVSLAAITEKDFVKMERAVIRQCFDLKDFASKDDREAQVKRLMAFASSLQNLPAHQSYMDEANRIKAAM